MIRRCDFSQARPCIEPLEDRQLLSTCYVTRLTDTGVGKGFRGDLRYCVNKVNAAPGADVIDFTVQGTVNLQSALPAISDHLQISGPAASQLTVRRDAVNEFRIFQVQPGQIVGIRGITITNGKQSTGVGGGIINYGVLSLIYTVIASNTASSGGGIYNGGVLSLNYSTVSDNLAISSLQTLGGGIDNNPLGILTIESSAITGNTVESNGTTADGGGVANRGSAILRNTTVSDNHAKKPTASSVSLRGAGAYNAGDLVIAHCTIAVNTHLTGGSYGGGIFNEATAAQTEISNSIIAQNWATHGLDVNGAISASAFNLYGASAGGSGYAPSDQLNVDPLLGPLADNGGPTQTMALLPGSPAIDAGDNTGAPQWDQRGEGFPRIVNGTVDIGAFEVQATIAPTPLAVLVTAIAATDDGPNGISGADDLVEAFNESVKFIGRHSADSFPHTLNRERTNLTDLHPRALGKLGAGEFQGQRKAGTLGLARDGHGNNGAGTRVEDICTDYNHGAEASLFAATHRV